MDETRRTQILNYIDLAIPQDAHLSTDISVIPPDDAQDSLNVLWDVSIRP